MLEVTLLVLPSAQAPPKLAEVLAHEGIALVEEKRALLLVWVALPFDPVALARILEWTGLRVGCAPGGGTEEREQALALGFDDFMTGAISLRELAARLFALVRQLRKGEDRHARFLLAPAANEVWVEDRRIALTPLERKTLQVLMASPGQVVSREKLAEWVWGGRIGGRAIDNLIQRLRQKMDAPEAIITVRGIGYRFSP